ncbi:hypothetical protein R1flu_027071 [Riccia fluitans]|uniref:Uncharacterized protein n=1 Tax=Riccia fluitans TaxID=41844 RepID=A0ABD1XHQ4_9MARC
MARKDFANHFLRNEVLPGLPAKQRPLEDKTRRTIIAERGYAGHWIIHEDARVVVKIPRLSRLPFCRGIRFFFMLS